MVNILGLTIGKVKRVRPDKIAALEEKGELLAQELKNKQWETKLVLASVEQAAFTQLVQEDALLALAVMQPKNKFAEVIKLRNAQVTPDGKSSLKAFAAEMREYRELMDELVGPQQQAMGAPDDGIPGLLQNILNSKFAEPIGDAIGNVIENAVPQPGQQANPVRGVDTPPATPQIAAPAPAQGLPPLNTFQAAGLAIMVERTPPEQMAARLLQQSASTTPQLIQFLDVVLTLNDDELTPFLSAFTAEPGWERVISWLVAHPEYTVAMVAELRRLVEAAHA